MRSVAYVIKSFAHMECILNMLQCHNPSDDVTIWYETDKYGWLTYISTKIALKRVRYSHFCKQFYGAYDEVILFSSNGMNECEDCCNLLSKYNCTSLLHLSNADARRDPQFKDMDMEPSFIRRFITLSPYVKPKNRPYVYKLMCHDGIGHGKRDKIMCYSGHIFPNEFDDDFRCFIENLPDWKFFFFTNTSIVNPPNNVVIIKNCNTFMMTRVLQTAKYYICRKTPYQQEDRFTGGIALALSHGCCPIIQAGFANDYNIPGLTFRQYYSELLDNQINADLDLSEYHAWCRNNKVKWSERPKNIYQLYDDTSKVNPQVSEYLKSINPDYSYRLLDFNEALELLEPHRHLFPSEIYKVLALDLKHQHKSDILRAMLLYAFGGVYLDVDLKPLMGFSDMDLPDVDLVTSFGCDYPESEYDGSLVPTNPLTAAGFLVSKKHNKILYDWLVQYATDNRTFKLHASPQFYHYAYFENCINLPLLAYTKLRNKDGATFYIIKETPYHTESSKAYKMVNRSGETLILSNGHGYGTLTSS